MIPVTIIKSFIDAYEAAEDSDQPMLPQHEIDAAVAEAQAINDRDHQRIAVEFTPVSVAAQHEADECIAELTARLSRAQLAMLRAVNWLDLGEIQRAREILMETIKSL